MLRVNSAPAPDLSSPCPFFAAASTHCRASLAGRPFERSRLARRCQSDDHDNCPLFMARLLRSSPVERTGAVVNLYLK